MLAVILPLALHYELENQNNVKTQQFTRLQSNSLSDESDTVVETGDYQATVSYHR